MKDCRPTVYFVQLGESGPIKIGYSDDLGARLSVLRTYSPGELRLLFAFPGTMEVEGAIHAWCADARLNGEWFQPTPDLLCLIDALRAIQWPVIEYQTPEPNTGTSIVRELCRAIAVHVETTGESFSGVGIRAGYPNTFVLKLRRASHRDASYRIETSTLERLAATLGMRVVLQPIDVVTAEVEGAATSTAIGSVVPEPPPSPPAPEPPSTRPSRPRPNQLFLF